jgi:hypothetical protein
MAAQVQRPSNWVAIFAAFSRTFMIGLRDLDGSLDLRQLDGSRMKSSSLS